MTLGLIFININKRVKLQKKFWKLIAQIVL